MLVFNKDSNEGNRLVGAPACGDVMKLQIKVSDSVLLKMLSLKLLDVVQL